MKLKAKSPGSIEFKVAVTLSLLLILAGTCSLSVAQAEREFMDKANGFKITLAGSWRAESYKDAVGRERTEFVYENRDLGVLRITRQNLGGSSLGEVVRREINDFTLCNSCVSTGQEAFAGPSLSGIRVAHYYVEGNRKIAGEFYFLLDNETVWILRFNGRAGSPGMAREITERMARSFYPLGAPF
ncbi:MAG TPA: hypothetical protein VG778_08410 [Blastocatellia bacterium]|jgi:hypothetical protein|nr:hypothetical protein [Blastocatellia bacterium]